MAMIAANVIARGLAPANLHSLINRCRRPSVWDKPNHQKSQAPVSLLRTAPPAGSFFEQLSKRGRKMRNDYVPFHHFISKCVLGYSVIGRRLATWMPPLGRRPRRCVITESVKIGPIEVGYHIGQANIKAHMVEPYGSVSFPESKRLVSPKVELKPLQCLAETLQLAHPGKIQRSKKRMI